VFEKTQELTPAEQTLREAHAVTGQRIIERKPSLVGLGPLVRSSHERWDGSGYPDGLEGEEIPLPSRICAVCDVFDALLSPRPYKDAWPLADVIRELASLRGTHLDPALVDAFLPIAADLHAECFGAQEEPPSQADAAA